MFLLCMVVVCAVYVYTCVHEQVLVQVLMHECMQPRGLSQVSFSISLHPAL